MRVNLSIDKEVFNDVYLPYLFADAPRIQIFFGGSSSGKSVFLAQRAVLDVAQGGRNYLVCRNVARTIRNSCFNEILKAINRFKLQDFFKVNKSEMTITCANGYQILFAGLDDPEKIKSITPQRGVITDIWVEEATETDRTAIKQLDKRLRGESQKSKRLILSFNPILQDHWIVSEFFYGWNDSKNVLQDEDRLILRTTYKDNKFLTQDDVEAMESETDPYFRDVYVLGRWGVLGHVIFKNWHTEDLSEYREALDNFRNGLDFGFAKDPAALIHTAYDRKRNRIYILDEVYETGLTNDVLAKRILSLIGKQVVFADSAEPKSIAELRNFGVNIRAVKKGKDSVFGNRKVDRIGTRKVDHLRYNPGGYPLPPRG
ncbi:MAG: PBSX family phage terminase large subunit [Thermoanaerobacteraceae bacterium]|nr:PBSX family phage terminase large subunit [Thermoanaerobacteraceae bacterium]